MDENWNNAPDLGFSVKCSILETGDIVQLQRLIGNYQITRYFSTSQNYYFECQINSHYFHNTFHSNLKVTIPIPRYLAKLVYICQSSNTRQTLSLFAKQLFDLQGSLASGLRHEEEVEDVGGERDGGEQPVCPGW